MVLFRWQIPGRVLPIFTIDSPYFNWPVLDAVVNTANWYLVQRFEDKIANKEIMGEELATILIQRIAGGFMAAIVIYWLFHRRNASQAKAVAKIPTRSKILIFVAAWLLAASLVTVVAIFMSVMTAVGGVLDFLAVYGVADLLVTLFARASAPALGHPTTP